MMRAEILELHNLYNKLADLRVPLLAGDERMWFDFLKAAQSGGTAPEVFSKEGLELTLTYLRNFNSKLRRDGKEPVNLKLWSLIGDTSRFAGWWGQADQERRRLEARKRMWQPTEREKTLAAWRKEDVQAQAPRVDAKQVLGPLIANLQRMQENAKSLT